MWYNNIVKIVFGVVVFYTWRTDTMENIKIINNPGIYFEDISSLKIITARWNMVTYYNLTNFDNKYVLINNYVSSIVNICETIEYRSKEVNSTCVEFKAINNQVLEKIRKDKNTLKQYLATDENSRRKRNSYFGLIGKIQKTLFGVLTEEEGEEFASKIKELEDKQLRIMIIEKEQAIVFKNTVNSVSQTLADFQNFRNTVGEKISNISI